MEIDADFQSLNVGDFSIIGKEPRWLSQEDELGPEPVSIGRGVQIGCYTTIEHGVEIGPETDIGDRADIGYNSRVGPECTIKDRAQIGGWVEINSGSTIEGFLCERAWVGEDCEIYGDTAHTHNNPDLPWDSNPEPAMTYEQGVIQAEESVVIGSVTIGENSYIAPKAVVTKDVPPEHAVARVNRTISYEQIEDRELSYDDIISADF